MRKKTLWAAALLVVLTSVLWPGAFAMAEEALVPEIRAGELLRIPLSESGIEFEFVPASNSEFDICLFPVDGEPDARAELWLGDELLAEGEDTILPVSMRLTAGERYTLRISGSGDVRLEIARHALSRCFATPMRLDAAGDEYTKAIARSGDVHWYSVTGASDGQMVVAATPREGGPALTAMLFDLEGRLLAEAAQTAKGAFLLDFDAQANRPCFIRVSASDGSIGSYNLALTRGDGSPAPDTVRFEYDEMVLMGRNTARLQVSLSPSDAGDILLWESSDPSVAQVSQTGRITGRREGTAVVTAYAVGGAYARCRVEVRHVPVDGVDLFSDHIAMNVGDDISLECAVSPANAVDSRIEFEVSPEGVVEIEDPGIVRAVGEGTAVITVRTLDGGFEDRAEITVGPAVKRYRALLVGEQNYAATVASARPGSANSVYGMRSMLEELSYEGAKFRVSTRLDASRDGVIRAIRETFDQATEQDLSLFYITCHGYYADGVTHLQMADGSVLTAVELERELRQIPGEIVLMVDCCGSGGVLGEAGEPEDILNGIIGVFSGNVGAPAVSGSKYRVLASAALEQDSYRISLNAEAVESDMATVFARALCEGAGWSISDGQRSAMRADVDFDSVVTFNELYNYVRRRAMWYLDRAGEYVQTVQVWPEGDVMPVFERTGG